MQVRAGVLTGCSLGRVSIRTTGHLPANQAGALALHSAGWHTATDGGQHLAMAHQDDGPELLTTAELAALLRKTPNAVIVMRYRGVAPPGFRCGRNILYPRRSVDTWIAARLAEDPATRRSAE